MKNIENEEINITSLLNFLWQKKFLIILTVILFSFLGALYALSLPDVYKSRAVLAVNERLTQNNSSSGISGLASGFGISVAKSDTSPADAGLVRIKSLEFFKLIYDEENYLIPLFAAKKWDFKSNELSLNQNIFDYKTKSWVRSPPKNLQSKPSIQEAHRKFLEHISISKNNESGVIVISAAHISPYVTKKWVEDIISEINLLSKRDAIVSANQSIEYLSAELAKSNLNDLNTSLSNLIESNYKTISIAESSPEFLFKVLDPAYASDIKVSPTRSLIVFLFALSGFFLSIIFSIYTGFSQNKY